MILDVLAAAVCIGGFGVYPVRVSRVFRPFFSLDLVTGQMLVAKAIVNAVPEVIDVFLFLFINLVFFGLIGNLLFSSK